MRFRSAAALCVSLVSAAALAQQKPPSTPQPAAAPQPTAADKPATQPQPSQPSPVLLGEDGKAIAGVSVSKAKVHAIVRGPLAEAIVTLTFKNDLDRVLGGELTFPLPDGATISGYGLDMDDVMVDGVAVEKQEARVIYEKEVRKTVDPGLVEHVIGNNFRTRLYPIPAKGTRTVKVSYVTDLVPADGKKGANLSLPLGLGDKLEQFDLTIAVEGATEEPTVRGGTYANKPFQQTDRGYYLQESLKDAKAVETLTIALPEVPATSVTVQKWPAEPTTVEELERLKAAGKTAKNETFFVLTDSPVNKPAVATALKNERILIAWDASLGRQSSDLERELHLVQKLLAKYDYPSFDILLLRNDLELKPSFSNGQAEAARAIQMLRSIVYDGATNFGALSLPKNRADFLGEQAGQRQYDYRFAVLFTDGISNLGSDKPAEVSIPVWAVATDASANHNGLRSLCQSSGGAYLNLNRLADADALATVGQPTFSIIAIEADAKQVAELTPGVATAVSGRVTVAGQLLADEAKVTLVYGHGKTETNRQTFTIKGAGASEGSLVSRYWAQQKVNELALAGGAARDDLLKIGKQYNLVTPATSLLVLETADQYVQHGIVPPKTRPQVYEAFTAAIETRKADQQRSREEKVAFVLGRWNERVKWWEREFKYPKNFKYQPPPVAEGGRGGGGGGGGLFGGVPPAEVRSPEPRGEPGVVLNTGRPTSTPPPSPASQPRRYAITDLNTQIPDFTNAPDFNLQSRGSGGGGGGGASLFASGEGLTPREPGVRINIQTWDPNTPYLAAMRAVAPAKAYDVYLQQRTGYAKSPSFYFDSADYLLRNGQAAQGIRVLTDVLELKLEDARLIRIVARRLQQQGELNLAVDLFERVTRLRPQEPQSFRDLALALAARADANAIKARDGAARQTGEIASDYARSLDLLNKVVIGNWERFEDIELIALTEASQILAKLKAIHNLGSVANLIDPRLLKNLDCDVRIILTWDADATDIDLWVTEPSGEVCRYDYNRTAIGGAMSRDFTDGYGPEEYLLRRTMPGEYKIQANFFGSRQQELTGACTVEATVITHFGRPNEARKIMSLRLTNHKDVVDVGTVNLK